MVANWGDDQTEGGQGQEDISEKETQSEFEAPSNLTQENTSTDQRPDAVHESLVAYSLGPVARSDPSQGIFDFAWYARADNDDMAVYIARENAAGDGWQAETQLFTYTGDPIDELDLAFNVNGDPVIPAERPSGTSGAPELWVQFFDSSQGTRVFTNFGSGRNPVAVMDQPAHPEFGDVIVVYVSPSQDAIAWREQGDRYQTESLTPVTGVSELFTHELGKTTDKRLQAAYAVRDPSTNTYSVSHLVTRLYPYIADTEAASLLHEMVGSPEVVQVLIAAFSEGNIGSVAGADTGARIQDEGSSVTHEPVGTPFVKAVIRAVFSEGDVGSVDGKDTGVRTQDEGGQVTHEPVGTPTVVAVILAIFSEGDVGSVDGQDTGVRTQDEGGQVAHEPVGSPFVAETVITADDQPAEGAQLAHEPVGTPTVVTV